MASAGLCRHVVHRCLDGVIRQCCRATARGHRSLAAGEAFQCVLVKRVVALGNARPPVGLVAWLGCAGHAWHIEQTEPYVRLPSAFSGSLVVAAIAAGAAGAAGAAAGAGAAVASVGAGAALSFCPQAARAAPQISVSNRVLIRIVFSF